MKKTELRKIIRESIREVLSNSNKDYTIVDFIRMVRDDMMAGAAPDEFPSDSQVLSIAKRKFDDYSRGANIDDLFETNMVGNYGLGTQEYLRYRDKMNEDDLITSKMVEEALEKNLEKALYNWVKYSRDKGDSESDVRDILNTYVKDAIIYYNEEQFAGEMEENYGGVKNEDISLEVPQWNDPTKLDQLGRVLKGMIDSGEITSIESPEGLRPTEDYKYGAYAVDESWNRVGRAIENVYRVQLDRDWWEKPGDPGPLADMNVVNDVLQLLEDNKIIYLEW